MYLRKGDEALREALNRGIDAPGRIGRTPLASTRGTASGPTPRTSSRAGTRRRSPARRAGAGAGLARWWRSIGELLASASLDGRCSCRSRRCRWRWRSACSWRSGGSTGRRRCGWLLAAYVELLRGTPLMLQLFVLFFLLRAGPPLGGGDRRPGDQLLGLRGGDLPRRPAGDPRGQMEAALALGMSRRLALRRVIVPQAVRIVIPPVTNDFIALFKDTSVCSVITLVELTKQYSILANSTGGVVEFAAGDRGALHGDEPPAVVVLALVRAAAGRRRRRRGGAGMIEVRDLVKRHGALEVLRGISLTVDAGRGRGDHRPVRRRQEHVPALPQRPGAVPGRVGRDRRPAARRRHARAGARGGACRQIRRRVGMVFQSFNLFPHRTVLAERHRGADPRAGPGRATRPRSAAEALLERVGLGDKLARDAPAALRRPAAARRDRPGPGDGAAGDPLRRADQRPRPEDDRRGPRGDGRPGPGRPDDGRRHPRHAPSPARWPTPSTSSARAASSSRAPPSRSWRRPLRPPSIDLESGRR